MMTHPGGDETALVVRGRAGDRAAFEELVRRTARWVFVRVYLEIPDAHRAEDLVQETFLRAWNKFDSLKDAKMFRTWLAAIAHGLAVDSIKRERRKKRGGLLGRIRRVDHDSALSLAQTNDPSPLESAEKSEQRELVLERLRDLPAEYRDVLTLRYIAGADYHEISKQLALSNGSLRGLLSRGMKMLRERMEK